MRVYAERELSPIKAGWSARCPTLHLAAHGRTETIADLNLIRTLERFLAPFARTGTLQAEVEGLNLRVEDATDTSLDVMLTP